MLDDGDYAGAVDIFKYVVRTNPHSGDAVNSLRYMIYCYAGADWDFNELRRYYTAIVEQEIDTELSAMARFFIPVTYTYENRVEDAVRSCEAIERDLADQPDAIMAELYKLSLLRYEEGDLDGVENERISKRISDLSVDLLRSDSFKQSNVPNTFSLQSVYPNPFNETTLINYGLSHDTNMSLKVFDLKGCEISILNNGFKAAGNYSAVWRARGCPSGVYIIQLQNDDIVQSRKVTLLR